jgi:predicted transcriptional regulator
MDWIKYGYVIGSKYRQRIIISLQKNPKTPKQISEETKIPITHVSFVLKSLSKRGIVMLLTTNLRKGKLFTLTKDGFEIAKKLEKIT